jgi:hypothetical protein
VKSVTLYLAVGMVGVVLIFGGLIWDAVVHARDPELAHAEGSVFTLSNPSHILLLLGGGLAIGSITTAIAGVLSLSPGRRLASRRTATALVAGTVTMAGVTAGVVHWSSRSELPIATGPLAPDNGPDNHRIGVVNSHGPGPCRATKSQKAAAQKLIDDTRAGTARYASLQTALAEGYTAPAAPGSTDHYPNATAVLDGKILDTNRPESLMYTLTSRGPVLVGVMYVMNVPGEFGPEVGGCLTRWHTHLNACLSSATFQLANELQPGETCPEGTFHYIPPPALHVWLVDVPGGRFAFEVEPEYLLQKVGP